MTSTKTSSLKCAIKLHAETSRYQQKMMMWRNVLLHSLWKNAKFFCAWLNELTRCLHFCWDVLRPVCFPLPFAFYTLNALDRNTRYTHGAQWRVRLMLDMFQWCFSFLAMIGSRNVIVSVWAMIKFGVRARAHVKTFQKSSLIVQKEMPSISLLGGKFCAHYEVENTSILFLL